MKRLLIPLLASAVFLSACSTSPIGRKQLMVVSPDTAVVESEKAYIATVAELDEKKQLINDPAWVSRIETITGRLVTQAVAAYPKTKDWKWSVAIIDDPQTLNAWCMAGGRMAIYSGIVTQLKLNDDEIAQIMGHEIAHALANHTAERMSRAVLMNTGLSAASQIMGDTGQLALSGTALAAQYALELPNSRTAESEADRIGIELAARAGYHPKAAVTLWNKMKELGGSGGPEFMSTHPSPGNRASTLAGLENEMLALNPSMKKSSAHPVDIVKNKY